MFCKIICSLSVITLISSESFSSLTLEELGVSPYKGALVMRHTDSIPGYSTRKMASGFWTSAKSFIDTNDFPIYPKKRDLLFWKPILLAIQVACFFGHKDAITELSCILSEGKYGVKKNEGAADAVKNSTVQDLFTKFEFSYSDKRLTEEEVLQFPGALAERSFQIYSQATHPDEVIIDEDDFHKKNPLLERRS